MSFHGRKVRKKKSKEKGRNSKENKGKGREEKRKGAEGREEERGGNITKWQ